MSSKVLTKLIADPSSLIQTILSVPELHRFMRCCARGLYRRWGIAPRPEDTLFTCVFLMLIIRQWECDCNRIFLP